MTDTPSPAPRATRRDASRLLLDAAHVMADMEEAGIAVDVGYLNDTAHRIERQTLAIQRRLYEVPAVQRWRAREGRGFKLDGPQLADTLHVHERVPVKRHTPSGRPAIDEEALKTAAVDAPWLNMLLRIRSLQKVRSTYLLGLIREEEGGFIHPFFNLHLARTYRSSSDSPNFQNLPIRDPELGPMVRRAFVTRPGRQLMEIDFKGMEVSWAYCYHRDPAMRRYLLDKTLDLHRDMAAECFGLTAEEAAYKPVRYIGKNGFVFPVFYGSYWKVVAPAMWEAAAKVRLADGRPLLDVVRERLHIKTLEEFTEHIRQVEERFWNERFPLYNRWRRTWWETYLNRGWLDMLTGFRVEGTILERNQCINYPVQGSAFHCLLWTAIRLREWLRASGAKSLLIGQIHDSILLDAEPTEISGIVRGVNALLKRRLPREWPWCIIPMEIEVETTPVGGSWVDKKEWSETE